MACMPLEHKWRAPEIATKKLTFYIPPLKKGLKLQMAAFIIARKGEHQKKNFTTYFLIYDGA